jgi:DNA-directed RNA polymerase specialized sigma24 family protein
VAPTREIAVSPSLRVEVAEDCRACKFGRGDDRACVLLESGDEATLFAQGPCDLTSRVREESLSLIRRRYPFAKGIAEDIASDVLLKIMESQRLLMPGTISHLPILERRLREVVKNGVIDALRQHKLITRLKCGACIHFEREPPPQGCHLKFLPNLGTASAPNPWYRQVERATDPRALQPPCTAFTWRRPDTHDIFEEEIPGIDPDGSPRERAVAILVQAIDRISRQNDGGTRVAAALFWHYLRGKEVKLLAAEAGVSEKTIKRLLADGRERLLGVLEQDFGITDPGEIL